MPELFSRDERRNYVREFGDFCMAYSMLQPEVDYFDLRDVGFLTFVKQGGRRFVLGNPVCDKNDLELLVGLAFKEHPKTSFYQISRGVAEILHHNFGFSMNHFGTETGIYRSDVWPESVLVKQKERDKIEEELRNLVAEKDALYERMDEGEEIRKRFWKVKTKVQKRRKRLKKFDEPSLEFVKEYLKGNDRELVRRQYNSAVSEGVGVYEVSASEWKKELLHEISDEWISTRMVSAHEMRFFTRPLDVDFDRENDVRLFVAENSKGVIGYLMLDPIFSKGNVKGYFADIMRARKESPSGVGYMLLVESMRKIFEEGYEEFNLGFSPFHKVQPVHIEKNGQRVRVDNKTMTFLHKTSFDYGSFLYNSKDQAFHKERFRGDMYPVYACSQAKVPIFEVMDSFKIAGIYPILQLREAVKRKFKKE